MDAQKVLQHLKDEPGLGVIEAYHVSNFKGHRERKDGSTQGFTLTLLDAGPTLTPNARYTCTIKTEDGRVLQGNPSDTITGALYILMGLRE